MQMTLTDANFDEELKKATVPVLVDFWAEWCVDPETQVSLSDGSQILAKNVALNNKLLGIRGDGLNSGEVSFSRVDNDSGHCKEITVETGRKVKVTDDHPLFTDRGWVLSSELKTGDKVAILPIGKSVLDELTPKRELVLARIVGFLFTDGTLYYQKSNNYWEVSFSVGQTKDVEDILQDLKTLGFNKTHVKELTKEQEIAGRKFTTHLFKIKCLSKELFELLSEKGVPVGAKKSQDYSVPGWIKNGQTSVKREFLRGFLGGDGPRVTMTVDSRKDKQPYNHVGINDLEFHKDPSLEKSGLKLGSEIASLLAKFGVDVTKVSSESDNYIRQDEKQSAIIHLKFKKDFQNAYNLVYNVGYAYCHQKQTISSLAAEFIRQILYLRSLTMQKYHDVLVLAGSGHGYRFVSRVLGVHPSQAYAWIKGRAKATVAHHGLKFDAWLEERQADAPSGFIWEKILSVEPIFLPAVAKITVEDTHSFVANGFLSHNCGPCRMMEPIIEEVVKEFEGKLVVGKLDVDANQQSAIKYQTMSIPTLIFFKNGAEAKRLVGYQDKATLVKNINEVLAS